MTTNRDKLNQLVERIVYESYTLDEVDEEPAGQEIDFGTDDDAGGDDLGLDDAGDDGGLGLDLDAGGDTGGDGGDLGLDDTGDDLGGDDFGGAGGGGLDIGGGGGGASPFEMDGDAAGEEDGEEEPAAVDPALDGLQPGESLLPEDPVQEILDTAVALRGQTGDHQQILNTVKALIQDYFATPDDAEEVITALWTTDDALLRVVARKLLLFIKGN